MRKPIPVFLLMTLGGAITLAAQLPYLVKDLNTDARGAYGSHPFNFVSAGERAFFATESYLETGYSIWTTDGSSDGTRRVATFSDCRPSWNDRGPILDALGDLVFFADHCFGEEWQQHLWRSDGTALGTFPLVVDLAEVHTGTGSYIQADSWARTLNGRLYFGARTSAESDLELWSSDGTEEGTSRLTALPSPPGSWLRFSARAGDLLTLFVQQNTDDFLTDIWSTDGTAAGTRRIASLELGSTPAATSGESLLYFSALNTGDPRHQAQELWVTDGTSSGTRMLTHFTPENSLSACTLQPRIVGDELLFCASASPAGTQVWRSDGTSAGTFPLSAFGNSYPFAYDAYTVEATKLSGNYYFLGYDEDNTYSLWRSEGTPGAAVRVRRIAGPGEYLSQAPWLEQVGHRLVFWGFDHGWKPFASDGTAAGTFPLAETCAGTCPPFAGSAGVVGNRLLFVALDEAQHHQLWMTRGTAASTFPLGDDVQDIDDGNYRELLGTAVGGGWLFPARDNSTGFEPWVADPARPFSAHRLRDLVLDTPGIALYDIDIRGSEIAFSTRTDFAWGDYGVFRSDGTAAGTVEIARTHRCSCGLVCSTPPADVLPASGGVLFEDPEECESFSIRSWVRSTGEIVRLFADPDGPRPGYARLYPLGDEALIFLHHSGADTEIWRSDGTEAGTTLALAAARGVERWPLTRLGTGVLLRTADSEGLGLAYFDAEQNTSRDLHRFPGGTYLEDNAAVAGASAYLPTHDPDEIWRTDGTADGTLRLMTLPAEHAVASSFFDWNGRALFAINFWQTGLQLWTSDGSAAGTLELKTFRSAWYGLTDFGPIDARALFAIQSQDPDTGRFDSELWETDGTTPGTRLLGSLRRDERAAYVDHFLSSSVGLFFETRDEDDATTLWSTSGTLDGTRVLWTNPARPDGNVPPPLQSVAFGAGIVFTQATAEHGLELAVSDGTADGTRLLVDLRPGPDSSSPLDLVLATGRLYFTADDGIHGRELWVLLAAGAEPCAPSPTILCLLDGRYRLELASARGEARALPLTGSTGGFALAGGDEPDTFVKLVDGSAVNRNHWLFGAGLEAEAFTLRVTDTADGTSKVWTSAADTLASFGDIDAFPSLPAAPFAAGPAPAGGESSTGGCQPVSNRLCFDDGRYLVEATAVGWDGATTAAVATPLQLGPHEGAFWLFDEMTLELVIRLRRDPLSGRVDLAVAALTNLGYEVRVLDLLTGRLATAESPAGTFRSLEVADLFPAP
ncbi:MAG: hypothetical protein ABI689_08560 [Thermoanaerobaculia bacterium]